jgi:hypothetical protein
MNETGIVQYSRELYPDGCLVTLFVDKDTVKLLNTENASIKGAEQ